MAQFAAKCKQLGDMPKLVKEIQADAQFPKTAKVLLVTSLPRLAAKWLNKAGISAEYQDELACVTAVLIIVKHDRETSAKLDKLILQIKKPTVPEKKEEQTIFGGVQPPAKEPAQAPLPAQPAAGQPQPIATVKI